MKSSIALLVMSLSLLAPLMAAHANEEEITNRWVEINAKDKFERSKLADLGMSIEFTRTGSVWGFADAKILKKIEDAGFRVLGNYDYAVGKGGHEHTFDFPSQDTRYHNYAETKAALEELQSKNSDLSKIVSIGKSLEGRDILAIHINTAPEALTTGKSTKPGAIFMGAHHAREHLSVEVPLMLAQYLLNNRTKFDIKGLINTRDIWIIPMVNPDGAEYDISSGSYKLWRKNRRKNADGTYGVDINRNYGYKWGTGGSSTDGNSDIYMGPQPFSEPETQAIRDLVRSQPNTKTLLTFHTFSELVLYPWGHTHDPIANQKDHAVFDAMAKKMAGWNHYTPEQSSDLYIASGDTTDWAYGELGIFAFTFEMSPKAGFFADPNDFYPGAAMVDKAFNDNLMPALFLLDAADNPYKILDTEPTGFLKSYVEPKIQSEFFSARN